MCLGTSNYWFETIMCSIFIFNYVDKSNGDVREPMEVMISIAALLRVMICALICRSLVLVESFDN